MPRISVVIPCFNLGPYLDEAVSSVLGQSMNDVEIIVVDDGSTDPETAGLLRDFSRDRTRVIRSEHRGLAAARNTGWQAATSDLVCFLDADDVLVSDYFSAALAVLDAQPGLAFVSSWLETFGDEHWTWQPTSCDLATLLSECTVCTAAVVRAAAVRSVGGFDERMPVQGYEDWDLWISLVERGFEGAIIPEVLFRYRRRADSMSMACCSGPPHLALIRYLVDKHAASYEAHAAAVLRHKELETAKLLSANDAIEREIHTLIEPTVVHRREEIDRLRQKLAIVARERARGEELARVSEALSQAQQEVTALRHSKSWRWMAPLRAVNDLLIWLTRRS